MIPKGITHQERLEQAKLFLVTFDARVTELLGLEFPLHPGTRAELNPRHLKLSSEARDMLETFYNRVELASGTGGAFEYMSGFAAKAPEMAARIASIQSIFTNEEATEVTAQVIENGIVMMEWYLSEMLRITDTGRPDQDLCDAETIRLWLQNNWSEEFVDKRTLMKKGPGHLRDGNTLSRCIQRLEAHGLLVRGSGKQTIDGTVSRTFWRVVHLGKSYE